MRVTIKDIAERAEVSIATVSLVMNQKQNSRISPETREKVETVIQELGYRPAEYARSMKGKNNRTLGLIVPDLQNHFYPEVTSGFSDKAAKNRYQTILLNSRESIEREEQFAETMISMSVSGVAICGINSTDIELSSREYRIIARLQQEGIPVIQFDRYYHLKNCAFVGIDNFRAAYEMTGILERMGYERIIAMDTEEKIFIREERIRGYHEAMKTFRKLPEIITADHRQFEDLDEKLAGISLKKEEPTVIFDLMSDMGAVQCMKNLQKNGFRIPEDIGIAGFDDIYISSVVTPPMTSVGQPKYRIGESAFDLLHEMIRGHTTESESVILPCDYVIRGTTKEVFAPQ